MLLHSIITKKKQDSEFCVQSSEFCGQSLLYDITDRLWGSTREENRAARDRTRPPRKKPRAKPKKGEKLPPRRPGIVGQLVEKALEGRTLGERPELFMQLVFAKAAVEPAAEEGLLGDVHDIPVSGDGTCIGTGGASRGIKICECRKDGVYNCGCNRRFSDPDARWGYDSYRNVFFYGHTMYALTYYNDVIKADIPLYIRLVQAQRHDSASLIFACSEFWELYPEMEIGAFIGDSAHDNLPTYRLFHEFGIDAVIALNGRSPTEAGGLATDSDGTPLCTAGHRMVNWGRCPDRGRTKFRCPLAACRVESCGNKHECSESPYGRTVYTHPDMDLRLFTSIPRHSDEWKRMMNSRTASERFNKRNSIDYEMQNTRIRGKKRIFMRSVANSVNIVLDARLKNMRLDFMALVKDAANAAA
ncbi:MAG: hypothetical protein FWH26_11740 [Oscillospiraceae bacterium]|nr:hypothetical protein [Oscillospiraceae bacterium]